MPDIYQIASAPHSEEAFDELRKILELLLGLAIRGENQAEFIEKIQQTLSEQTQAALVEYIKEVNENVAFSVSESIAIELPPRDESCSPSMAVSSPDCSFSSSSITDRPNNVGIVRNTTRLKLEEITEFLNARLLRQVKRVVDERDEYLEMVIELKQDKEQLINDRAAVNAANVGGGDDLNHRMMHHHHLSAAIDSTQSGCNGVGGNGNGSSANSDMQTTSDYLGTIFRYYLCLTRVYLYNF